MAQNGKQDMKSGGITHKVAFEEIRNYLAGRFIGATRDRALLDEVVKCLFIRAWATQLGGRRWSFSPASGNSEIDAIGILREYRSTFEEIKTRLGSIFSADDEILLDPISLQFVHSRLSQADLGDTYSDPLGDAYQAFVSSTSRGDEGQFFTPPAAVAWLVEAIDPKAGERILDPACGSGSFLSYTARYLAAKGAEHAEIATSLFGIEKDRYLSGLAAKHLAISTLANPNIACGDSLALKGADGNDYDPERFMGKFDVVLANPPFGVKIVSATDLLRSRFLLAYKWRKHGNGFIKTDALNPRTSPQILFIEQILNFLTEGGRAGLVLPESTISSPKYGYVVQYLRERTDISAIVGMPEALFKTSGKGGTHTKTCLVVFNKKSRKASKTAIYFAEARWCGHDSRGNTIPNDDLPITLEEYQKGQMQASPTALGAWIPTAGVEGNALAPRFYANGVIKLLATLDKTHELLSFGDLVEQGVISYTTGVEVGKLAYGTGPVPFIRTSDLSNWEIKLDPKHSVSEQLHEKLASKLDVRENDILMVKDGTYLIGSCALVTKYDVKIIYQSHLYKIRVEKPEEMSPELLLALLSCDPVQQQVIAKRVSQDIIDSLGSRINELLLPIPRSATRRAEIKSMVRRAIHDRIEARELARSARLLVCKT